MTASAEPPRPVTLQTMVHAVALTLMLGWVLYMGSRVLVPMVLGMMVSYLIIGVSGLIGRIPVLGPWLRPGWRHLLSAVLIGYGLLQVVFLFADSVAGFVARGQGTLVNIASVLALAPERFNATYSGSKAFLLNLSTALRTELSGTAIRVQAVLPGATRTELWGKAGIDVATLPADRVMDAGEMVDAALAGLDMGEAVTIPSLPDPADWARFVEARLALGPNLSLARPAARFGVGQTRA